MAKKFNFRLAPVLKYREIIETQKKKDFAVANRAVDEEKMRRENMQTERGGAQEDIRELYQGKAEFNDVVETYRYMNTLELRLAQNAKKLAQLEAVRETKRLALVGAQRDRKALEILEEKRKAEHDAAAAHEEQSALDELAIRARRRRLEEEK